MQNGHMRYISKYLAQDLKKKMVFMGGPRQVGKTTTALRLMKEVFDNGRYFNWDLDEDRQDILRKRWSDDHDLLVFDELHKMRRWKSWIKGVWDVSGKERSFMVTGSARLDVYRRGGDSLMGRYHYWRLHPFTIDERPHGIDNKDAFRRLMTVGGFPEPFLDHDERSARRWRRERFDRVLREDVRDLEPIRDIGSMSLFLDLLRRRVGGLVAVSNLAGDLQVSPKTTGHWLEVLEKMYLVFIVRPYTRSLPRAVRKAPKIYFFDNADVIGDEGARFENLVASSLLKRVHFLEDRDGYRYELKYIRDKEGREVDFAILKEGVLEELIEVKLSDEKVSRPLRYYAERLKPRVATQIVAHLKRPFTENRLRVVDPFSYFSQGW